MSKPSGKEGVESHKDKKPFLKWAGNKHQIIHRLIATFEALEQEAGPFTRLIEPFLGSGAVYLATNFPTAVLADLNPDLVNLYRQIQKGGDRFVEETRSLFTNKTNTQAAFTRLRKEFNANKATTAKDRRRKASLFIYLNRHCFNGLCRYNSSGGFNVPFGRYKSPSLPEDAMRYFARKSKGATFNQQDFLATLKDPSIGQGDLIYCDPPYAPLSSTASFTTYAQKGFGLKEQEALGHAAEAMRQLGATVVISNHDTPVTRKIYKDADHIHSFKVQRFISAKGASRKAANEILAIYLPVKNKAPNSPKPPPVAKRKAARKRTGPIK